MKRTLLALAVGAFSLAATLQARAVELVVDTTIPALFKELHEELARQYMATHPDVKIVLPAPTADYEEANQRILRQAVTNQLPDLTFQGLNRIRILADRGIAVDIAPFVAAEANWSALGYDDALLSLAEVNGKRYGLGFSLSTPVIYYNLDLVRKAGGDPDNLPKNWDEVFALARKIQALGGPVTGFHFDWDITGNWMWQALVFSHGGSMLTPDEKKVAFDQKPGQQSIELLGRMVTDAGMRPVDGTVSRQDFIAGNLGVWVHSTSFLGAVQKQIGGRFAIKTGVFPVPAENGRLPAGGNAVVMVTKDKAKQAVAWDYMKFVTGPVGATAMVKATGYFPANVIPGQKPDLLGNFYAENPNHLTAVRQLKYITGWYAFPGENGLKITDVIKDHLRGVADTSEKPAAALGAMTTQVQALLPRN